MPSGTPIATSVIHQVMDLFVAGKTKSEIATRVGLSRFSVVKVIDAYALVQRCRERERQRLAAEQSRHDALVDSDP